MIINQQQLIEVVSRHIKLVRIENSYTQQDFASRLGISKKTLVQIEKERILCGWTVTIAFCTLFRSNTLLQKTLGGDPLLLIEVFMKEVVTKKYIKTSILNTFWQTIEQKEQLVMQQNTRSKLVRTINLEKNIMYIAYDFQKINAKLK